MKSDTCQNFETETGTTPQQAAALLGLVYPRYMELRRGVRALKPYHTASMEAHLLLPKTRLRALRKQRGAL